MIKFGEGGMSKAKTDWHEAEANFAEGLSEDNEDGYTKQQIFNIDKESSIGKRW